MSRPQKTAVARAYSSNVRPSGRRIFHLGGRAIRGLCTEREWAVCLLDQSLEDVLAQRPLSGTTLQPASRRLFWADPWIMGDRDDAWIFAEEFDRAAGLGSIVALRVLDGDLVSHGVVATSDHQMSFPQVHVFGHTWIASVETCHPDPRIYAFDDLGGTWRRTRWRLPDDLVDPQLSRIEDGRWHLVATSRACGGVGPVITWVSADEQPTGWTVMDVTDRGMTARGGGTLDRARNLRAVQDCSVNYGQSLSLVSIDGAANATLDLQGRDVRTRPTKQWAGLHTCSWTTSGEMVVVDLWRRRLQPMSALDRYNEFRRDPCRKDNG